MNTKTQDNDWDNDYEILIDERLPNMPIETRPVRVRITFVEPKLRVKAEPELAWVDNEEL